LLGLLIRMQVHPMSSGLTTRHMAVDRIPFMLLAAAALTYYWLRAARGANGDPWTAGDERDRIPPAKAIDWIKAAGNYVEIRVAGRTRLLRMTLRQARALLPREQFIQIHRSVIVNRARIATVKGRRSVEMADGTSFTVGDAHRSNLPEL
jgi:LytTr DNA-binding domain